jgi:phenylalanyl-tRNA synthetase alpha chain
MIEKVEVLMQEVVSFQTTSADELEQFRISMLGKKGAITELLTLLRDVPVEQKKEAGQQINTLKQAAQEKISALKEILDAQEDNNQPQHDLTRPGEEVVMGARHPLSLVRNEIFEIFKKIGFVVADGPEIEDDWHNFTALNFPPEHPARDMQDTFFISEDMALRTHTSSIQIRVMENQKPPIRILAPGRVFRNEAISARAHCIFHQVEGLYVDKNVSFADLKQTLLYFAQEMFGEKAKIRLRPSYFPFTEPSAEVDVSCQLCEGKGCNVCKHTGFLEIMGCGMVDPNVLDNCGIDSKVYTGYAFGMGIERITMLKYGVNDLRHFFENDLRFLKQFTSAY